MTVTIDLNEDAVNTPAGWTRVNARKFTKTYSSNASETVNFTDAAGNTGTANVVVNNIDKVAVSSCDFVGTTPSEQATTYSGLVLGCNKNLTGATITAITSSAGGNISAISINGQGRIVFTFTTPSAATTQLRVQGTDAAGNSIDVTRNISGLVLPNQAPTASDFSVDA